jgi:hypothetical protein
VSRARLALLAALAWLAPAFGRAPGHARDAVDLVAQADVVARAHHSAQACASNRPGKGWPDRARPCRDAEGWRAPRRREGAALRQHGHGAAEYADGDLVIVFCEIERSHEPDALAGSGVRFVRAGARREARASPARTRA